MVQSNHATLTIASSKYDFDGIPNIVLIGVPDLPALNRVQRKLAGCGIPHCAWIEPDNDMGFTSIATVPLSREEKEPLAHYRLWRLPIHACSSEKEQPVLTGRSVVQVHPGVPILSAPVAQSEEHPILSGRVAGSNPAGRPSLLR
jgi:hypothetical protein